MTSESSHIGNSGKLAGVPEEEPGASIKQNVYAKYVLAVLVLVYVLNFIDRQILAILAEDIKSDLQLSDAQLGFLFGTAFAVFYATFGIVLGRLADVWNRKKLIAFGLGFWSLMTALSGLARSFAPLAVCRFGVGAGEASASPAAFSILYDYFSPKVRTTVLAIYSSGAYIGGGLGLFLGGTILDAWNNAWPESNLAPFGLKGWQAAFAIVGLPGVFMALWVSTLREPTRGQSDGVVGEPHPRPFRETMLVLVSMLPVVNWRRLLKKGGRKAVSINMAAASGIALVSWFLIHFTGDLLQWVALGIGIYAAFSWAQGLAASDPVVFGLIFKCRSLLCMITGGGAMAFMGAALSFWMVSFIQRYHGVSNTEAGAVLGSAIAFMGFSGIILGGLLADKLRLYTRKGKLYVWLVGIVLSLLSVIVSLTSDDLLWAYGGFFFTNLAFPLAHGPWISTVNDLMLPRGRATTSAFAFVLTTFVGFALGPYITGHISDVLVAAGMEASESLRQAMLWSLLLPLGGVVLVVLALPSIEADEKSLLARAKALGEEI